ncbi:hypothetical protein IEQ34_010316 [Dendrobium chrysotoxum]|uniref:Transcription factor CBF/NF-Y/archaeal histone domain-containing protein n=1 Tax=Dendrobium chrysotoxum TaxID=161865 RepID=A0AAV7H2S0_DENCH|nr:hypothetical protein IEQ34_010316 [Dendrobium chrysotoxum]
MASPGDGSRENGEHSPRSNVREQDRFLPVANISRIMKKALPANGKIAKDAKETMQECVSEFISFITSEASEKCQREKRKTINGDDLLSAMATLGFEEYIEPLKLYLQKYREGDSKLSTKVTDNAGKREATGLQVANQPGTSTQVEMKMPHHSSFAHGMTYMQSQTSLDKWDLVRHLCHSVKLIVASFHNFKKFRMVVGDIIYLRYILFVTKCSEKLF